MLKILVRKISKKDNRNTLRELLKSVRRLLHMDPNILDMVDKLVRDQITLNSAGAYDQKKLQELGLQLTVNQSNNITRFVGDASNPIYPEIIIWKPDFFGSLKGKAVLVEFVETSRTIDISLSRWRATSLLSVPFNLSIPPSEVTRVQGLLTQNNLTANLYTYTLNPTTHTYTFTKIN